MTQLLQLEFPEEVRRLVRDEETLKDLQHGAINDQRIFHRSSVHGSQEQQEANRPEHRYIDSHHPRAARFLKLCEAIRQRGFAIWGNYTLKEVFALPENPPVFTYQEVTRTVDRWKAGPQEERQRHLLDLFLTDGVMNPQRCQSFWHRLMEIRDGHLSLVAGEDLEEKVREGLKTASEINRLIEFLAVERGLFRDHVFSVDEWRALYHVFAKWAHFRKLQYYEEQRADERTLLYRVFEQLSSRDQAALYSSFHSFAPGRDPDPGPEFVELALRISRRAAQAAVDLALQRFVEPNGAEVFWAAAFDDAAKMILFDPNSLLYTDQENRKTFRRLAERAQTQEEIQLNFLTFFQQLVYGAKQGGSFSSQNCQKILSDHELLGFVWQATVTKPLNPRMAGSLRQHRNAIIDNLASKADMPLPDWWNRLEEVKFFSDDQSQEDKPDERNRLANA